MIEYRGTQNHITLDYETGKKIISFMVENASNEALEACRGKELRISIKEWKNKRSLDANAYYHVLIGKLASKLHMSTTELHNRMLMEYGQLEMINGQTVKLEIPDTFEAEHKAYSSETYHIKPTSEVFYTPAGPKRSWLLLRGSHTYNTKEFSDLLNGLIEECRWQGIPVDTPEQIERMIDLYERNKHSAG